ncbi:MAG: hypothetical protein ACR2KG_11210 [Nocardioidaceae bacterium]
MPTTFASSLSGHPDGTTQGAVWSAVVATSDYSCGITTTGTLWCWGDNASGQLGIGTTAVSRSPAQVAP